MKKILVKIHATLLVFGINLIKFKQSISGLRFYYKDLKAFKKQENADFPFGNKQMILDERNVPSGSMSGHYFHQDLYVARRIFENNPKKHLDIGSRTDGFVAHVASYRKIEVMDIRPQQVSIKNIDFTQADLMILPENLIGQYDSISSLHVIEHFGLGRYGDPIDVNGHLKALNNIHKMLIPSGKFYFSVPIGIQRIEFNAHRIFSVNYLRKHLQPMFKILAFSYVNDEGTFFENASLSEKAIQDDYNFNFGCGIFELEKIG